MADRNLVRIFTVNTTASAEAAAEADALALKLLESDAPSQHVLGVAAALAALAERLRGAPAVPSLRAVAMCGRRAP